MDDATQSKGFVGFAAAMADDGFSLPGFDVIRLIGFGGQAEVWLARDLATGQRVALKRLACSASVEERDRLRREAATLRALDHPHLLRLRSLVSLPSELVLVLDHADGGSLAGLLDAGPLTPGEAVTVLVPLGEALALAHSRGVVHGDVTPGNVLFTNDGRPLLADLGVARVFGSAGEVRGTAGFLAPELLTGAQATPPSDVYAWGVLGAVCLTGLRPAEAVRMVRESTPSIAGPYGHGPGGDGGPSKSAPGPLAFDALLAVLAEAVDVDPSRRPGIGELSRRVFQACRPSPVRVNGAHRVEDPDLTVRVPRATTSAPAAAAGRARLRRPGARPHEAAGRAEGVAGRLHEARREVGHPRSGRPRGGRPRGGRAAAGVVVMAAVVVLAAAAVMVHVAGPVTGGDVLAERQGRHPSAAARAVAGPTPEPSAGTARVSSTPRPSAAPSATTGSTGSTGSAASAGAAGSAAVAAPGATPSGASWAMVIGALDRRRATAFASLDSSALSGLYAPGSPALSRDLTRLAALAREGTRPAVLSEPVVLEAAALVLPGDPSRPAPGARVVVRVVDRRRSTELLDSGSGAVVGTVAARSAREWRVTLAEVDGSWRFLDVVAA